MYLHVPPQERALRVVLAEDSVLLREGAATGGERGHRGSAEMIGWLAAGQQRDERGAWLLGAAGARFERA
jgi:hypothetical protein